MSVSYYAGPDGQPVAYYAAPQGQYQQVPTTSDYYYNQPNMYTAGVAPRQEQSIGHKRPISPPPSPPTENTGARKTKKRKASTATGAKRYPCTWLDCDVVKDRACDLSKHVKKHKRDFKGPFTDCAACMKGFTSIQDAERHNNEIHGKIPRIYCDFPGCGHSSKRAANMKTHQETHGIPYIRTKGKNKGKDLTATKMAGSRAKRGKTPDVLAPTVDRVTKSSTAGAVPLRRSARLGANIAAAIDEHGKLRPTGPQGIYLPSPSQSPEPDTHVPYSVDASRLYQPIMTAPPSTQPIGLPALAPQQQHHQQHPSQYLAPHPSYASHPSYGYAPPSTMSIPGSHIRPAPHHHLPPVGQPIRPAPGHSSTQASINMYANSDVMLYQPQSKPAYPAPPTPPSEPYHTPGSFDHNLVDPNLGARHLSQAGHLPYPQHHQVAPSRTSNYDTNSEGSYHQQQQQQKYVSFENLVGQSSRNGTTAGGPGNDTPPYDHASSSNTAANSDDKIDYRLLQAQSAVGRSGSQSVHSHPPSTYSHPRSRHASQKSAASSTAPSVVAEEEGSKEKQKGSESALFSDLLTMNKIY